MKELLDSIKAARAVSTPLLAISTPDQPALADVIARDINGKTPIISWDRARGMVSRNDEGKAALHKLMDDTNELEFATAKPQDAMRLAIKLPKGSILIAHNMDRFLRDSDSGQLIQAIANLRDQFKSDKRTLVMLSPGFDLPIELRTDCIILDDPLPDDDGYKTIITELYEAADIGKPSEDMVKQATLAVRGLSAFVAEQQLAMSIALSPKRDRIDVPEAWEMKKRAISQVKGLTMSLTGPKLADLRGLDSIVGMLNDLFNGPASPQVVVRVDEIDKAFAGLGSNGGPGDNTGVTQDALQQFLTNMEDNEWTGSVLVGIRGSGKTVLTQSIGAAYGVPTIAMDMGQMKGKHVGESEQAHREAFRTIKSIGGHRVCVLATCNKLNVLPAELMRRFKLQVWYFDLLTKPERDSLWPIYLKRYGHAVDAARPDDEGWTGAEIRNCCEVAYQLNKPVEHVGSKYIIPVTKSDPNGVAELRNLANGRFLSASYSGTYQMNQAQQSGPAPKRKLSLGKES